jgi:O-antigen/teichoic acid export membrane protein
MTWLAIGFFLNAIVSSAYIISLACNKPGIPLKVSLEGLLLYIPALVFLVNAYGVKGAAFAYAGLNIFYLIVFIPAVNGGIINQKVQSWLIGTVAPFIFSGFIAFGCAKILSVFLSSYWEVLILILSALIIYILLAWHFISPGLRGDIYSLYRMMPWYKDG